MEMFLIGKTFYKKLHKTDTDVTYACNYSLC